MEKMMKEIRDSSISDIACKLVANERDESDRVDFYLAYEEASELNEVVTLATLFEFGYVIILSLVVFF